MITGMTERKTNLCKTQQNTTAGKGKRCRVCTGCGRCPGVAQKIHILTEGGLNEKPQPIGENSRKRLVTADVGTTTLAMKLYGRGGSVEDVFAAVNPQTVYGADVLSRIQAAENPADADKMKQMVRETLAQGIRRFRRKLAPGENLRMVLAANTTMNYLLMGLNPAELGRAPFHAAHLEAVETKIDGVSCYCFPGLSAFVGGDITAGIYAADMLKRDDTSLLIDLGTNGEMVLGNRKKLLASSVAAGPAFEGGVNRGVWGADMISLLAALRKEGILDETGLLTEPYFETGVLAGNVRVTQESVRAVQLAKAAVLSGIRILTEEYGISMEQIERVILSGGFGYYLSPEAAGEIGLLPQTLVSKTVQGGNTALAGALKFGRKLLGGTVSPDTDLFAEAGCNVRVINLAERQCFAENYFASMNLCPI